MEYCDSSGVTGIVWRRVDPAREAEAEVVMQRLMALCRQQVGFLGSEIFPPIPGVQEAYVVLYRFNNAENLRHWLKSGERDELFDQIAPLLLQPPFEFFLAHRRRTPGTASSVFAYRIRPGAEEKFREWRQRILEECRKFNGFLGTEAFDTVDSEQPEFVVVVRFNNRANLDAWLHSKVRAGFMKEVPAYVERYRLRRMGTGFEGWFNISDDTRPPVPWRQGMVVLAALFPVIMTLRHLLGFLFTLMPFPVAFLVLLTIDVTILTYFIMPHFSRIMNFWLRPKPGYPWWKELAGWMILLSLLGVTLAVTLIVGN